MVLNSMKKTNTFVVYKYYLLCMSYYRSVLLFLVVVDGLKGIVRSYIERREIGF